MHPMNFGGDIVLSPDLTLLVVLGSVVVFGFLAWMFPQRRD